eukprot:TRINITY_DN41466_c0_g1_i1.p1 TRINITY_DN41466_c0_g1~~TRINITY_DN41466_c0_g1_i1.p1  ORF type:complete len:290 (+),score=51.85 TRINITY_DN41466_c0_g1_i1:58-927(+)
MPEPISCAAAALGAGGHWLYTRIREYCGGNDKDLDRAREQAGRDLQYFGYTCQSTPSMKFLDVVPQTKTDMDLILDDPVLQKCGPLKGFVNSSLKMALKMGQNQDDLRREYVDTVNSDGRVQSVMALFFARAVQGTYVEYARQAETIDEVYQRFHAMGDRYHAFAATLKQNGVDGSFLSANCISDEDLQDEFGISSAFQRRVLLHEFQNYKPQHINRVAVGLIACYADFVYDGKFSSDMRNCIYGTYSLEEMKVRIQKMMAFQSAGELLQLKEVQQSSHGGPGPMSVAI